MSGKGLILAAPTSGSGKTTVTLGLLRALTQRGEAVRGAKSGPDYIDPRFHEAACGQVSMNLDAWAMPKHRIRALADGDGLLLIEGAMGLFDGAPPDGDGATADLARILGLPVVLVVNAGHMSHSVAALVRGFASHDPEVRVAGVILNNVGSPRHEAMLRRALAPLGLPVLGALRRDPALALPDRHLGLVQASEHPDLTGFLDRAAEAVAAQVDLDALTALACATATAPARAPAKAPARIAIARDAAFSFTYPHQIADWTRAGSTLLSFSPLADEPVPEADLVYLPGGYPELHAATLAANTAFLGSLRDVARTTDIYGECGGYMVLGESLTDAGGTAHRMAGLIGLSTSFAQRKLHLGYRRLTSRWNALPGTHMAHEFHYATTLAADGTPLFEAQDAEGTQLPPMGLIEGRVAGSFAHIIDHV
ncbi:cobyrinate a,c-diamide synthase [Maritimibacter sp. UBA3975]|uniref:cobyrinate a,c-diamide synthase n=1 Tax=Maritimibacter sp. UBA3975 TaxID=1946833 RepID=UPI000C0A237F|nr:cobyrinate a,c-diamide synthase [Maritimibacter sp. UBA3975]MAM60328.1 cobyrinic acid a,c-diamide synthase [Maritimibacter sp.]|tara:strand:+ start:14818 stop:16086 length:1269 start_codon:yes stop_codon:yes gene_type:complete